MVILRAGEARQEFGKLSGCLVWDGSLEAVREYAYGQPRRHVKVQPVCTVTASLLLST